MKIPLVDPKTRQPVAPVLSAQDQYDLKQDFAKMDESPDPEAYAKKLIAKIQGAPEAIKKAIKLRADWREAELESENGGVTTDPQPTAVPTGAPSNLPPPKLPPG